MPKKAPTIKFGGLYHYPNLLAVRDQADFALTAVQKTIYLAPATTFIPIEYAVNKVWESYGGYHRCMKILTESGIIGYVCLRTTELTEVISYDKL